MGATGFQGIALRWRQDIDAGRRINLGDSLQGIDRPFSKGSGRAPDQSNLSLLSGDLFVEFDQAGQVRDCGMVALRQPSLRDMQACRVAIHAVWEGMGRRGTFNDRS